MANGSSSRSLPKPLPRNSLLLSSSVMIIIVGIILALTYQSILKPPLPKLCGSLGGPPITAPRIKLRDGRHLAYKEHGLPREKANHKIVFIHGSDSCRHDAVFATLLSPDLVQELGVYMVSFDKPGYGESDPDPNRTPKSLVLDIEELADQLSLGSRFYVIGKSMGGQAAWGCLKYIPHRLAGVTLVAPVVNYYWRNLPLNISTEGFNLQQKRDQWSVRVAHYAPWLIYWWNTQNWFPGSSVANRDVGILSQPDKDIILKLGSSRKPHLAEVRQQGIHESINRDMIVGFGNWEFDPIDLENPFLNKEGSVHLWQGDEDMLVPVTLQRYIAHKLPWLHYHEVPGSGHFFPFAKGVVDEIVKTALMQSIN
ncbi:Alpha/beta hydrolase fold-1 [Arabidopsis thaliana x Arabidopsis arenosa]|uniref:Alpha/beta hydrolase fold-1 n=1 Tax=Arabidopsis thaliana x Arabidopsis arenosa TaxID=1240361 RepID=A0A8T2BPS1_9BRAS|nr:Alpha/beta hydrolase fold-1 [Arabidopsis thaliana x Arabidopsis arenosa]